jgi:hypothetical protein
VFDASWWTSERVALAALIVSLIVAGFQVVTWLLHYRIRVKVLVYSEQPGDVTVEVQNYSHDWTITVEGLWLEYGSNKKIDVRHAIDTSTHRIEPHAACFARVPEGESHHFTLPTRLRGVAKIKTKRWKSRSSWLRRTVQPHPANPQ